MTPPEPATPATAPATPADAHDRVHHPDDDQVIVDPRTGAVLEPVLTGYESDLLADLALELKSRESQLRDMRKAVEAELVARMQAKGRRRATVGDYELAFETRRARVWDPDELEHVLRDLVDRGSLHAGDLTGLITHQTVVDGRRAQRLLESLHGRAKHALETCFRWESKGRPALTITPCVQLEAPAETTPAPTYRR